MTRLHGDIRGKAAGAYDQVYALVRRIPAGHVMTYGQIATLIENRLSARAVGWAMHGCPEDVPWQRVVNASGGCSTDRLPETPAGLQRSLLEAEGLQFGENGTIDLERYRWTPPEHAPSRS
jgi:methylated-DNA-protein-cysteine methyltransferase-like protein